ncbi:MAG: ABC transporter permease subunit [Gammaproteobacteria bacterium]|nr:ABC transporter permease subunit [Gammaproteobacteria bacterium]
MIDGPTTPPTNTDRTAGRTIPIAIALIRGLLAIDTNTVDMLRVLGASRIQQLVLYRIPNSIPSLLTGIRIRRVRSLLRRAFT